MPTRARTSKVWSEDSSASRVWGGSIWRTADRAASTAVGRRGGGSVPSPSGSSVQDDTVRSDSAPASAAPSALLFFSSESRRTESPLSVRSVRTSPPSATRGRLEGDCDGSAFWSSDRGGTRRPLSRRCGGDSTVATTSSGNSPSHVSSLVSRSNWSFKTSTAPPTLASISPPAPGGITADPMVSSATTKLIVMVGGECPRSQKDKSSFHSGSPTDTDRVHFTTSSERSCAPFVIRT
mmetsp:Transcript_83744/g.224061  ORF Transcript_83744/g.224061 Transcript_83744/m.224061 type:complete len:237 (+) Transcript_83744:773-1483(+)